MLLLMMMISETLYGCVCLGFFFIFVFQIRWLLARSLARSYTYIHPLVCVCMCSIMTNDMKAFCIWFLFLVKFNMHFSLLMNSRVNWCIATHRSLLLDFFSPSLLFLARSLSEALFPSSWIDIPLWWLPYLPTTLSLLSPSTPPPTTTTAHLFFHSSLIFCSSRVLFFKEGGWGWSHYTVDISVRILGDGILDGKGGGSPLLPPPPLSSLPPAPLPSPRAGSAIHPPPYSASCSSSCCSLLPVLFLLGSSWERRNRDIGFGANGSRLMCMGRKLETSK